MHKSKTYELWLMLRTELREALWLASMVGGLSIIAVAFAVAVAVSGALPNVVSPL